MIFCISVVSVIIPSLSFLIYLGSLFLLLFFIRPCGILFPKSGIGPLPPSLGAQSLNHWTTCEVLGPLFNLSYCILYFSAVWLFFFFFLHIFSCLLKFSCPSILLTWVSILVIITLNTFFPGRLLISLLSSSFSDVSCYFICNIFICFPMFPISLCISIH